MRVQSVYRGHGFVLARSAAPASWLGSRLQVLRHVPGGQVQVAVVVCAHQHSEHHATNVSFSDMYEFAAPYHFKRFCLNTRGSKGVGTCTVIMCLTSHSPREIDSAKSGQFHSSETVWSNSSSPCEMHLSTPPLPKFGQTTSVHV